MFVDRESQIRLSRLGYASFDKGKPGFERGKAHSYIFSIKTQCIQHDVEIVI